MKKAAFCMIFIFALMIGSCGWDYVPSDSDYFDYDLRGLWVSNNPYFDYYGCGLFIDYSNITIYGYNYTPGHPLTHFTTEVRLKGYSETGDIINSSTKKREGMLYIEDRGEWQEGIPFYYWENYQGGKKQRFLVFPVDYVEFSEETLVWYSDDDYYY